MEHFIYCTIQMVSYTPSIFGVLFGVLICIVRPGLSFLRAAQQVTELVTRSAGLLGALTA